MSGKKYIRLDPVTGRLTQQAATDVSDGSANAGDIVALDPSGKISQTMLPAGVGQSTISAVATEALSAGDLVQVYSNGGVRSVRKANATDYTKPSNGFVLDSIAQSASGIVYLGGQNTAIPLGTFTPADIGKRVFLSTTAGGVTTTPPTAPGNLIQPVGVIVDVGPSVTIDYDEGEQIIA